MKIDSVEPRKFMLYFFYSTENARNNGTKNNHMLYLARFSFSDILIDTNEVICVHSIKIDAISSAEKEKNNVHGIECLGAKIKIKFIFQH